MSSLTAMMSIHVADLEVTRVGISDTRRVPARASVLRIAVVGYECDRRMSALISPIIMIFPLVNKSNVRLLKQSNH